MICRLLLIALLLSCTTTFSEPPATAPSESIADKVLPELNLQAIPLPDVINFLRDVTGANIVLMAQRDVDPAEIVVNWQLKEVTLSQVFQLLTNLPDQNIDLEWPDDEHPAKGKPIIVVRVNRNPDRPANATGTTVLSLASNFSAGMSEDESKKRTVEITTAISSALDAAGLNTPAPGIYFHPQTHVLIVKGTGEQRKLLTELADCLTESASVAQNQLQTTQHDDMTRRAEQLERALMSEKAETDKARQRMDALEAENQMLRRQLQDLAARRAPATQQN